MDIRERAEATELHGRAGAAAALAAHLALARELERDKVSEVREVIVGGCSPPWRVSKWQRTRREPNCRCEPVEGGCEIIGRR